MSSYKAGGFAYLWTLMIVAFMGIGLAIGGDLYATSLKREKEKELLFVGHQFRAAIARYLQANAGGVQGVYPASIDDLLKDPRFPGVQRHLRRLYRDPITGRSEWAPVMQNGRVVGVHSLSEQVPIKQDNFDDSDKSFRHKQRYADWKFTYPADLLAEAEGAALKGLPKK
jgi:type II secretory pathway pseudopilin PulG